MQVGVFWVGKVERIVQCAFTLPPLHDTNFPVASCQDKDIMNSTEAMLVIFLKQMSKMQRLLTSEYCTNKEGPSNKHAFLSGAAETR